MSAATYERLRQCAAEALGGGLSVIVDATCQRREQRERLSSLGPACQATVHVVFCHAPHEVLETRIAARDRAAADASEADRDILALQEARFEPIEVGESLTVIDADTTRADVVARVLEQLQRWDKP
jgi:predicted kinase